MTQIPSALLEQPAPPTAAAGREAPEATPESPFAALLGAVPVPVDVAVAAGPTVAGAVVADGVEPEPLSGRVLSPGEAFREQARGIVLTRATRPIGVPADATALPLRPPVPGAEGAPVAPAAASSPSLPIGLGGAAAEGRGEGMGAAAFATPVVARATRLADVLQAATARPGAQAASATAEPAPTPSPATVAGAAAHAQSSADGQLSTQAAAPATPAASGAAPASPSPVAHTSAPAQAAAVPARPVGLEHAVETVRLALRHGAERGVSHARISLTPRELGTIEVHLRHTADGLVARVVAEHASAAQQLQQAGAELRRSLEQQGLTLLRLDIGASGDETANRRGAAFDAAFGHGDRGNRRGAADADATAPIVGADLAGDGETTTTLQLPNGALVDVLA